MAYNVVAGKIKKLGYCCAHSYFYAVRGEDEWKVASELGVNDRTVRRWRAAYRENKLDCLAAPNCFFAKAGGSLPQKSPGSDRGPALDLDPVPSDEHAEHRS